MNSPADTLNSPLDQKASETAIRQEILAAEPRNILLLASYEIVMRLAWIFKTESVIIPAFVDTLTGGMGLARGWLPVLNRIGQSFPPLFFAERLRDSPRKSRVLGAMSLLMALTFACIALLAAIGRKGIAAWMPGVFFVLYVLFFSFTGLNQLTLGTTHGKLIRADRRGRLMGIAGLVGPILAIVAAWTLLRPWLEAPGIGKFVPIFSFTATGFAICALMTFTVHEPAVSLPSEPRLTPWRKITSVWTVLRTDRDFRRAARVAILMICILLLFPHFQWLARVQLGLTDSNLAIWVITQNVGVATFSFLFGLLADRCGNRLVVRYQSVILASAPIVALILTGPMVSQEFGRRWYWIVFVLLGVSPVTMRTITNYTLELVDEHLHPQYLSTMRVCFLLPLLFAPLGGVVLDLFGEHSYQGACLLFGSVSGLIVLAGLLTFRMSEPRHRSVDKSVSIVITE